MFLWREKGPFGSGPFSLFVSGTVEVLRSAFPALGWGQHCDTAAVGPEAEVLGTGYQYVDCQQT